MSGVTLEEFTVEWDGKAGRSYVRMPSQAQIIRIGERAGIIRIWAEVGPWRDDELIPLWFIWPGGERPDPAEARYLGTLELTGNPFVAHVYADRRVVP